MKKILCLAMAIVMMMAIAVPAFAVEITEDNSAGNTDIQTLTTKEDGTDAAYFMVSIPAKVQIYWGAEVTYIPFTVECQLATGKVLDFDVKGQNNYLLKAGVRGMIPYALLNGNFKLAESVVKETTISDYITITTIPEHWMQVPVDNYADLVTFTVSVVDE